MKREFWEGVEIGGTKLSKEVIDMIMAENGKDIEETKKKYADYDTVKQQLEEANSQIQSFKDMDIDGIKRAAADWEQKAKEAKEEADKKIAALQFDSLIETQIRQAKGRGVKSIRANLDLEALRESKNQEADVKAALEKLKESDAYLFDTEDGKTSPKIVRPTGAGGGEKDETERARAIMGLPTKVKE